ncbi:MAG: glutaredoxin family protein [Candidatus Methanofastidiosa archaeon]|nr:glutaredoxin family protein [Candidatus Methanofastidiosa archaeon]
MEFQEVEGRDAGEVILYALSTCGWCKRTKELIESLGVGYRYIYVDLLEGDERKEAVQTVRGLNPNLSFPTLVINGNVITGFKEEDIEKALKGD